MTATLRLLPQPRPEVAHPLLTLTQGEPVLVADADVDLIDFVNAATQVLEPTTDPDTITPATMQVAWFVHHVGDTHRTGGDRSVNLGSHLARWILPFLIELSHTKPVGERTVADLWFAEAERLAKVLAGAERLPAATVAGDLLGRRGVACVWLTILEAGQVCHGGAQAITDAISRRQLVAHRDGAGHVLVRTADLRTAGLLIEKDVPTGVDRTYAKNILYPFKQAMLRAANLGAHLRGNFETVRAIEPLARDRARAPRVDPGYISLTTIAALGPHLTVVFQIVLWLLRLMGLRIGEAYGLLVSDLFFDEATGAWVLAVEKQGGRKATVRNPDTGELERRDCKPGTKTTQSHRFLRVPDPLAAVLRELVAIFHTSEDGSVDTSARLIPGLRKDDATGTCAFRTGLYHAIDQVGGPRFHPHDLRGSLITDLKNDGVNKRVRLYYSGHKKHRTVHDGYDDGVPVQLQRKATRALARLLTELSLEEMIAPTDKQQGWGQETRNGRRAGEIRRLMRERGWEAVPDGFTADDDIIDTNQAAERLGISPVEMRRRFTGGEIRAVRVMRGKKPVWMTTVADVDAFARADQDQGTTLKELAARVGLTYHQTRTLCLQLGVLARTGADKGTAIRLDPAQVTTVVVEAARRRALASK